MGKETGQIELDPPFYLKNKFFFHNNVFKRNPNCIQYKNGFEKNVMKLLFFQKQKGGIKFNMSSKYEPS